MFYIWKNYVTLADQSTNCDRANYKVAPLVLFLYYHFCSFIWQKVNHSEGFNLITCIILNLIKCMCRVSEVAYDRAHHKDLINKNMNGRRHKR